jgi:hypothetical protein
MGLLSLARMIPGVGNALTFLGVFKGPCLILGVAAFVIGSAAGGYSGHKITRAFDHGEIADAQKQVSDWKSEAAQARIDGKVLAEKIMKDAKEEHDEQMESINAVAGDIERLAAGVRDLSGFVSSMRVSPAATGPSGKAAGVEPRPACSVLQDLAADFAFRADTYAGNYNSLMLRWEKLSNVAPPKE